MSTTPNEIWSDAQKLPEATEVQRRAKISRCYYALYSRACEFSGELITEGNLLRAGSGMHSKLTQKLTNPTIKDPEISALSRQMGTQQMMAYDLRLKADYYLDDEVTVSDVRKCVGFVRRGIEIPLPSELVARKKSA